MHCGQQPPGTWPGAFPWNKQTKKVPNKTLHKLPVKNVSHDFDSVFLEPGQSKT